MWGRVSSGARAGQRRRSRAAADSYQRVEGAVEIGRHFSLSRERTSGPLDEACCARRRRNWSALFTAGGRRQVRWMGSDFLMVRRGGCLMSRALACHNYRYGERTRRARGTRARGVTSRAPAALNAPEEASRAVECGHGRWRVDARPRTARNWD
jgi:hypothetical protein